MLAEGQNRLPYGAYLSRPDITLAVLGVDALIRMVNLLIIGIAVSRGTEGALRAGQGLIKERCRVGLVLFVSSRRVILRAGIQSV